MKKLLLILFFCTCLLGFSKTADGTDAIVNGRRYKNQKKGETYFIIKENGDTIYTRLNRMPEFQGVLRAMFDFLAKQKVYPPKAKADGFSGKVYVNFIVGKYGMLRDVNIIRGVHPLLDKEAIRVVKSMPKWNSGIYHGKPVSVNFILPIKFKLSKLENNLQTIRSIP
jgi:protein TonB